jgi:hypothetical protein
VIRCVASFKSEQFGLEEAPQKGKLQDKNKKTAAFFNKDFTKTYSLFEKSII